MNKILLLISFAILFSGCLSQKKLEPELGEQVVKNNKKVFEQEDTLIMFALRAEQLRDYESSAILFDDLYNKSNKKEYLYRSLRSLLVLKHSDKILSKIDEVSQNTLLLDNNLKRIKIVALVQKNQLDEALAIALSLVEETKSDDDYILVSEIYVSQEKFDIAVKYLESAYSKNYNEKILDKMSIVLYVNLDRKKDAIAQLETHTRIHGCSKKICQRLISFYSNDNNIDGLLSSYLRYYEVDSSPEVANKIVQLYGYKKDYAHLILFLENSHTDDKTLVELYVASKDYKKAYKLSQDMYDKSGDVEYFAQSIIYQYENQKDKNNKVFLKELSKKFEDLLAINRSALYLNYYGYILIDHEIDIQKGMKYVREALKIEENSSYYLDSLAWGYYKLGECKKALRIMKKVVTLEGGDDPEVIKHYEAIKKCKGKK